MSQKKTVIHLPGLSGGEGLADNGHRTREEMIRQIRKYALRNLKTAETILAAKDDEFIVYQCRGVYVERNVKVLKP